MCNSYNEKKKKIVKQTKEEDYPISKASEHLRKNETYLRTLAVDIFNQTEIKEKGKKGVLSYGSSLPTNGEAGDRQQRINTGDSRGKFKKR